ncbi:Maf family protein [Tepidibacillus fermentans]|uniref:dTTP/UTP pyrophosphatase n=1 Tax=Tepidibacillus fermentans TaxID=1281767 RepID=A0A4R3K882_9BACI|nr:Maf family protein [Tepidibacillus fermentans]TCS79058.1 septum formation protein [Tepidibacillus fermentans]
MKNNVKTLILASSSPRRRELLELVGVPFFVHASQVSEEVSQNLHPSQVVEELALRKAEDVSQFYKEGLVIGADTIVVLDEQILGKPKNRSEAFTMLKMLQGRSHTVYSGIAIIDCQSKRKVVSHQKTNVKMRALSDEEIRAYISTNEPLDKAGSYGIQGIGAILVERIEGDYFNVVGLPLALLYDLFKQFNISILNDFHAQKQI